jgi:PAS domain S-box-containing protein
MHYHRGRSNTPPPTVFDRTGPADAPRDIFFAAVETTRMPMTVTDPHQPDNPIIFVNRAFEAMTGYDRQEIVGRNCRFLQGPDTDEDVIAEIGLAVRERREIAVELLNYRKNGATFWNALFISPVFGPEGELLYYFGSQLDISRRRDAEDALRHAQKMESLGQLTGGIAHDFNNLLQVVLGYVDVLKARTPSGDRSANRALDAISSSATRGATLTQQLLAFARKQDLRGRLLNLNDLVTEFLPELEQTVGPDIKIDTDLDPELWNCRVDPVQAEVALLNLVTNARDAMPSGGTLTLATSNRNVMDGASNGTPAGEYSTLTVRDTGMGIPAARLKQIFEPFYSTKDVGKGTGLGLAMVYGFARQSGGAVDVESRVGEGTGFTLYFPRETGTVEFSNAERVSSRGGPESILMVEDQDDVAALGETFLGELGYDVVRAQNASHALVILRERGFDLLFSDIVMPGALSGVGLAREARRAYPEMKVLLTTGFSGDALSTDPHEFELIRKPYRRDDLAARVRTILDSTEGTS